ncbi:hypothetical protein DNM18_24605 [Salmonella enterica subsp. enterica]|nr:hypothetical protein [Salmonella enterica subsp. enterica serovar Poona]ECK9010457.1 hypothetical protein [Salmonella enterica subsp. enterica serovar Poona]EDR6206949.1 hypothetical protein [Salmonella enterica subsp. enterica serovar Bonariensis]EEN9720067.1 hypothetical protein [Salmonella enterica]EJE4378508.1 hypothetical protein [Salmonella enterica]
MTLLKIVLNALHQVLTWCASSRAQQFVEDHFREEGYDEDSIDIARQTAALLAGALITALMAQILRLIATHGASH